MGTVASIALAVVLGWFVLSRTFVAYIGSINPQWALAVRASDATAQFMIAEAWLANTVHAEGGILKPDGKSYPDESRIRQRVLQALQSDPLSAWGFELLGILSASDGDTASAIMFMQAAVARSKRRPAAAYWLLRQCIILRNIECAIHHADVLLRIRPDLILQITPALVEIATLPAGTKELIAMLAAAPPWREKFFEALADEKSNAELPAQLFLGLLKSEHPPEPREASRYLRRLIAQKYYEQAYSVWLQLLPPKQLASAGLLFNGSFQYLPSGLPFDWAIDSSAGAIAAIVPVQELPLENALSLELGGGRVDLRPVYQFLVLAPGRYRLVGMSKGMLRGPRGLKWQIACVERPSRALGESQAFLEGSSGWSQFTMSFDIPPACRAQLLRLVLDARSASETLVAGSFAFTGLMIERDAR
ncbi:hypothetical protein [Hyphomicrobium sp.]|uniref:hypothetical protein n=1 Tax=Hyphomicrobium sp. TaxID=82 RepID=UPI002D7841A3|nr:hypothetical protein [Hyphomicrobium sp.]HET6389281.1 hypothetical protein [Hyphomicrobium sp.]